MQGALRFINPRRRQSGKRCAPDFYGTTEVVRFRWTRVSLHLGLRRRIAKLADGAIAVK